MKKNRNIKLEKEILIENSDTNLQNFIEKFGKYLKQNLSEDKENNLDTMKKEMESLLNDLSKNTDSFNSDSFIEHLETYLNCNHKRLLYSQISVFIYSKTEEEKLNLGENLNNALDFVLNNNKFDEKTKGIMIKLWDHVNLANSQIEKLKTKESAIQETIQPYIDEVHQFQKELENTKKDIFTQLISIVSIFVAISFVMFGGMSLINGLFDFSNMKSIPLIELICLGSITGIIMISAIYAFIIFSLRLSFREFSGKSPFRRTYLLSISSLTVLFLITFMLWIINLSKTNEIIPNWGPWFILVLFVFILFCMWYSEFNDLKKDK